LFFLARDGCWRPVHIHQKGKEILSGYDWHPRAYASRATYRIPAFFPGQFLPKEIKRVAALWLAFRSDCDKRPAGAFVSRKGGRVPHFQKKTGVAYGRAKPPGLTQFLNRRADAQPYTYNQRGAAHVSRGLALTHSQKGGGGNPSTEASWPRAFLEVARPAACVVCTTKGRGFDPSGGRRRSLPASYFCRPREATKPSGLLVFPSSHLHTTEGGNRLRTTCFFDDIRPSTSFHFSPRTKVQKEPYVYTHIRGIIFTKQVRPKFPHLILLSPLLVLYRYHRHL
jgi:hypothetical protein